jgi:hypothetical protein
MKMLTKPIFKDETSYPVVAGTVVVVVDAVAVVVVDSAGQHRGRPLLR